MYRSQRYCAITCCYLVEWRDCNEQFCVHWYINRVTNYATLALAHVKHDNASRRVILHRLPSALIPHGGTIIASSTQGW